MREAGRARVPRIVTLALTAGLIVACDLPATPGSDEPSRPSDSKALPDLVGKGLQVAQDAAQGAGFSRLTSHDALGRGRDQVLDRNWKVCVQQPGAGKHPVDVQIDFGTVKLDESCPKRDRKPSDVEKAMVDFRGKSLKAARQSLPSNASIQTSDASGRDRVIIVESNWRVCTQEPAPKSAYDGEPVTFTAVKFDESCP